MRKILLTALVLSGFILSAQVELVKFKDAEIDVNQTIPEEQRGYVLEKGQDGVIVRFSQYLKGKTTSWPYIGVCGSEIKVRDWRPYKYLNIKLRNLDKEVSPIITIVARDTSGKVATLPCWSRCNSMNELVIPVSAFSSKIDLAQIHFLQLAMPDCGYNIAFELISAELTGKAAPPDPNAMISRVFDVKKEIQAKKAGVLCYGAVSLDVQSEDPLISIQQYKTGMDKWPGLTLKTRVDNMLMEGDWSTKTHVYVELELVSGEVSLGFSLKDDERRNFWHSIGSLDRNASTIVDRMIYDMGQDLSNIDTVSIGRTMPSSDGSYRIKAFRLEFRPETVYLPVAVKLEQLLKLHLNRRERALAKKMKKDLDSIYAKVKGEQAKCVDIKKFFRLCEENKETSDKLMRENQFRLACENMKGYPYAVGIADSMTSVFIDDKGFLMPAAKKASLELAKNEYESFQVVVISFETAQKKYTVTVSPLKNASGVVIPVETAIVGFAKTKRMTYPAEYTGWYPDFVIRYQEEAWIQKNEAVPFWVRLRTDKNTPAGIYKAIVTVSGEDVKNYSFPLEVKVRDFTLPVGSPLPTSFNVAGLLHEYYKPKNTPETEKIHIDFAEYAAKYKMIYDRLYYGPYGTPKYASDAWKKLSDSGDMQTFCICNTSPHPKYTKDRSDPNDPGVERLLQDIPVHMSKIGPLAEKGGFYDKAYFYGFDEWKMDAVTNRVFSFLKKNWPEIPIMTTAAVPHADLPGLENLDIWVPIAKRYADNPELVQALRKRDIKVWWYICNFPRPPEPSFMLEVPAAVPRMYMGMMSQKYKPDGFLYWALIAWKNAYTDQSGPVDCGPRTNWNPHTCGEDNEEGNLFVPGKDRIILPTIRAENFRDGVEDLWYYKLLEKLFADKRDKLSSRLTKQVQEALSISERLVKNTSVYTSDPVVIRAERSKLATLIEKLSRL